MSTPIVTEIISPPEPVTRDPFIDDLGPQARRSRLDELAALAPLSAVRGGQ